MSEEETTRESTAEIITDAFDSVFEEIAGKEDESKTEEKPVEEPKEEKKRGRPKATESKKETESLPDKGKIKEEPQKKTAKEEAEEAGGKLLSTIQKQPPATKREEPKKEEPKKEERLPEKEPVKLASIELEFSDDEKEFLQDFPHTKGIIEKMIAKGVEAVITKQEEDLGKKGFLGKADVSPIAEAMIKLAMRVEQVSFENTVLRVMPDAPEIIRSEEFKVWIKEQPRSVQLLNNSLNPDDALKLLNYYKEAIATKRVAEHDKAADEKTKKMIDLMEDTVKGKGKMGRADTTIADNFDDAFDEAYEEARRKAK